MDAPSGLLKCPYRHRHPVVQTGRAFYLLIFHYTNPMPIPFHPYQLIPFHSCLMNTWLLHTALLYRLALQRTAQSCFHQTGYGFHPLRAASPRVCLKIAFRQLCVPLCGRFGPDEGGVAGYVDRIGTKYAAKWGVQMAGMNFQTHPSQML